MSWSGPQYGYWFAGTWEFAMYGVGGQRLLTVKCTYTDYVNALGVNCVDAGTNMYFGGKLMQSRGVGVVTDRLGSVRANGNGEQFAYYPYGEERTSTPDGREKWGTYTRDGAGTDYADQRYYNVGTGRFSVPDPQGLGAADLANPTSWNHYAYVHGDPVNRLDWRGLCTMTPEGLQDGENGLDYGASYFLYAGPCSQSGGFNDPCNTSALATAFGFVPTPDPSCYVFSGPPPSSKKPPQPECKLKVETRSTEKIPGASHASVVVTDAEGNTFTMEGFPDYSSFPFGNLAVQNTAGDINNSQWGQTLTTAMIPDLCDRIARIEAAEAYYASNPVRYGPDATSNTLAHWLLQNGNLDQYFSSPPGAVGWNSDLYGHIM
jgi:RHS repeat-associated protein